jgi:hypothetical protein
VSIQITAVALAQLQASLQAAPQRTVAVMLAAMTEATLLLQREVQDTMPAVSGITRNSIGQDAFSTPVGALGVVGSNQPSAVFVELGTRPHMPPVEPLVNWVQQRLGVSAQDAQRVAWLVARKIARVGTPKQLVFKKAIDKNAGQVRGIFEAAAQRLAQMMVGGPTGNEAGGV